MHSECIASFATFATYFTLMFYVQMSFAVSPHIPPIRELLSTRSAGKLGSGSPFCLADHTVQDCCKVYTYIRSVLLWNVFLWYYTSWHVQCNSSQRTLGFVICWVMLPQGISGFADFLAHFTDVCYIQMCFTMPLHISPVRKLFATVGTSVFHEGSVVSLSHNDHGVQDSGQSLCWQWLLERGLTTSCGTLLGVAWMHYWF